MGADTFISVNKSMITNQSIAQTSCLLLQRRKTINIAKSLKRRI